MSQEQENPTQPEAQDLDPVAAGDISEQEETLESLAESVSQKTEVKPAEEKPAVSSEDDEVEALLKKKPATHLPRSPFHEKAEGEKTSGSLVLPPADVKTVLEIISKMTNVQMDGDNQRDWLAKLKYSLDFLPAGEAYQAELDNKDNGPTNTLAAGGKTLALSLLSPRANGGVQVYEGERAFLQILNHRGTGGVSKTPLWNSGFYVYFKPCLAPQFLELLAVLNSDTLTAGRDTYGLALSSDTAYTLSRLVDFVLQHVYSTSVVPEAVSTATAIKQLMKPQDTWSLLWGFLCACFKNGIDYEQPCVADPSKCTHIDKGVLDLTLLQIPFKEKLTDWHISHMSKSAQGSMSLESIKRYQDELPCHGEHRVVFDKGTPEQIAITIKTPTTDEFLNQATNYIDSLTNAIAKALSQRLTEKERNAYIEETARATAVCKYAHYIAKIEFGDVDENTDTINSYTGVISDRDGIRRTLSSLSEDVIRDKIIEEIVRYVGRSAASAIGIPAYKCKKCGGEYASAESGDDPSLRAVIPIDIIQLFFELVSQRMQRLVEKPSIQA